MKYCVYVSYNQSEAWIQLNSDVDAEQIAINAIANDYAMLLVSVFDSDGNLLFTKHRTEVWNELSIRKPYFWNPA